MSWAPFIPAYVTLPIAAMSMLAVAAHLLIVERHTTNFVRRRIRLANGWVMLISIPLIAAGFSFIDPDTKPRMFAIVWITIVGLVSLSIVLAMADILNTFIHTRRSLATLQKSKRNLTRLAPPISPDQLERPDGP